MSIVAAPLLAVAVMLLLLLLGVAVASLALNAGYIVHELGWFPHTKDRTSPHERAFAHGSRYDRGAVQTHDYQVMHEFSIVARRHAHAEVYDIADPHRALENVIARYEEQPNRSRYDDLIHVSNYVSNEVGSDERVEELIGAIHELMHKRPPQEEH
jgi:hypothetical protein